MEWLRKVGPAFHLQWKQGRLLRQLANAAREVTSINVLYLYIKKSIRQQVLLWFNFEFRKTFVGP